MTKRTEVTWNTDANGMLLGARAHDGLIADLSYSKNLLSVRVKRVAGDFVLFEFDEVTELNLTFWEGSILSEVFAWKLDAFAGDASLSSENAWKFLYRERAVDLTREVERTIKKKPKSMLIHLLCSYGGEIAAICNRVTIYQES